MSKAKPPSVEDVEARLTDRLSRGVYAVGSRLPSCRALAGELESNPSTVDRAVRRLAERGVLRTVPRRGTFVRTTDVPRVFGTVELTGELSSLVERAVLSGITVTEIRRALEEVVTSEVLTPRVVLLECNDRDLATMSERVAAISGLEVIPRLIGDPGEGPLDADADVVVVPYFHLAEVSGRLERPERLVPVNVRAAPRVLRRLATLDPAGRVFAVAPTERGVQRMCALVSQYYSGDISGFLAGSHDPSVLEDATAVVVNNAAVLALPANVEVVGVEWEIEDNFGSQLLAQVKGLPPLVGEHT
ncbi:GntR family transcriptional regulator [Nocardioides houyundeii]|uniref:GntR family transcriptional regulator n=1 Tax=Nocardioides houyundeii TaxID=2045452 RepID=UPI001315A0F4|nr:GntR family transcriptional regulator [Nocardioides houyundeii]